MTIMDNARTAYLVIRRAIRLYAQKKAHHWSATITLFSFLMIFPTAIFLTSLAQILEPQQLSSFLTLWMPQQAVKAIVNVLTNAKTPRWSELFLSFLAGLWGISHILHSIIEISDEFYDYHSRHFWHRRFLAFLTLAILIIWQFLSMLAYSIITWVGRWIIKSGLFPGPSYLVHIIHWLTTLGIMVLQWVSLVLLYAMSGPTFKMRDYMPGALFSALFGWLANRVMIFYIRVAPVHDFYGALTNFFIFLIWVYWESTIFIIGIGVNRIAGDYLRSNSI